MVENRFKTKKDDSVKRINLAFMTFDFSCFTLRMYEKEYQLFMLSNITYAEERKDELQNKEYAMQILVSKLLAIKEAEYEQKMAELKGENVDINFGSQIRSYVFHPYKMVKDHRTGCEVGNVDAVMDGDIDEFVESYLRKFS